MPDRHAVLQRLGRPVPEPGAQDDLCGASATAKLSAQLLGRVYDQRLELVDGTDPSCQRAAPRGQQHPQGLLMPTPARTGQPLMAERLASGPDSVQRVGLGAGPAWGPLGPAHLDHPLPALQKEAAQAGAIALAPSSAQQRRPGTWVWAKPSSCW